MEQEMNEYPTDSQPHIEWNYTIGPLLTCRDGSLHRLTLIEILWLKAGFTTVDQLDEKYGHNDEPQKG